MAVAVQFPNWKAFVFLALLGVLLLLIKLWLPASFADPLIYVVGVLVAVAGAIGYKSEEDARANTYAAFRNPGIAWPAIAVLAALILGLVIYRNAVTPPLRLTIVVQDELGGHIRDWEGELVAGARTLPLRTNAEGEAQVRLRRAEVAQALVIRWSFADQSVRQEIEYPEREARHTYRLTLAPPMPLTVRYYRMNGLMLGSILNGDLPPGLEQYHERWAVVRTPAFIQLAQLFEQVAEPSETILRDADFVRVHHVDADGLVVSFPRDIDRPGRPIQRLADRGVRGLSLDQVRVGGGILERAYSLSPSVIPALMICGPPRAQIIRERAFGADMLIRADELAALSTSRRAQDWARVLSSMRLSGDIGTLRLENGVGVFQGREVELEVLVFTNETETAVSIGEIGFVDAATVRSVVWPQATLATGASLVVPTNLRLINPVRGEDNLTAYEFRTAEEGRTDTCEGYDVADTPGGIVELYGGGWRVERHRAQDFYRTLAAFENAYSAPVFVGAHYDFRTIVINGARFTIRASDFGNAGVEAGYQVGG